MGIALACVAEARAALRLRWHHQEVRVTLYLDNNMVSALLPMSDAISCVDKAFRLLADGAAANAVRRRISLGGTTLNVMWAMAPTEGVMGVKEYPVVRQDVTQGVTLTLLLHAFDSGELLAVMQADLLGRLRTGAASAVATKALARADSRVLAVYGSGFQAETQVLGLAHVLPDLCAVRVVGRDEQRRDRLISRLRAQLAVEVRPSAAREAAEQADIIVTATGSAEPVVLGSWVRPGTHINAVGSNVATKREIDRALLERTALVVVDDRKVAAEECGDLIANSWELSDVVALGDVLTERAMSRSTSDEITLFESQGLALQDVVCAGLIYARAAEGAMGQRLRV
jgi:alanine dehydrogenase